MDYATFRYLCSLPLTRLGLWHQRVVAPPAAKLRKLQAQMPPVTGSWQWLTLSTLEKGSKAADDDCVEAVLDDYGSQEKLRLAPAASDTGLQYLALRAASTPPLSPACRRWRGV